MGETALTGGAERSATAAGVGAALCVSVGVVLLARHADFFHDDAYITLRYVARWLGGQGLSWNDAEWVEGFTHPLWLLQLAALGATGLELPSAARGLGVAYLGALLLVWRRAGLGWEPALLLAAQPGLALWAWGGLETVSLCVWLVLALAASRRAESGTPGSAVAAGLAFGAAVLTRPEALGIVLLVAGAWLLTGRRAHAAWLLAAALAPVLLWEAVRWLWFGDWLPNSARAKLGGVPPHVTWQLGLAYLLRVWWAWLPAATVAAWVAALRPGPSWLLEVCAAAWLGAVVLAGGDHMPGGRFALPAGVLFALAAAARLRGADARCGRRVALACLVAALVQLGAGWGLPTGLDPAARVGERVGRFLESRLAPGTLVATATAGSTPYFAPSLGFVDTLGLNDRTIARRDPVPLETRWQAVPGHRKGDGAYVLGREPEVVILGPAQGYAGHPPRAWFLTDFELVRSPAFGRDYAPRRFALGESVELVAFVRRGSPAERALAAEALELAR